MNYDEFIRGTLPLIGYNWIRYRKPLIRRRLSKRISSLNICSWEQYSQLLLRSPNEQRHLHALLGITISRFWRNESIFHALETDIIPSIVHDIRPEEYLDVWCVGAASGQEALSLSMLLSKAGVLNGQMIRSRIIASDIDQSALRRGSTNRWEGSEFRSTPPGIRTQFKYSLDGRTFSLPTDLFETVLFICHDFFDDPPVSNAHLVFCRNSVLTYTAGHERERIIRSIASVLPRGGCLVIGRKEQLPKKWTAQMGLIPLGRRIYKRS